MEETDTIRTYFLEQRALAVRAVALPEVCKKLGISVAAINTLIKHGKLVEDTRLHRGIRTVTKHSLDDYRSRRPDRKRQAV